MITVCKFIINYYFLYADAEDEKTEEEVDMMKLMGFSGFETTKVSRLRFIYTHLCIT